MSRQPSIGMNDTVFPSESTGARQHWMAILARAPAAAIEAALTRDAALPAWIRVRGPETGLVMVRGRAGGSGSPFNLGEMTVTRCTIRLESGTTGHAYIAGRDERQAELAAVADALLQDPATATGLHDALIRPLSEAQREQRQARAEKAAATRVEFFAMRNMRS
jgi:alpha-D-ribose 1-methylphosphonate 5-triphosphate synthase subunit PhnG